MVLVFYGSLKLFTSADRFSSLVLNMPVSLKFTCRSKEGPEEFVDVTGHQPTFWTNKYSLGPVWQTGE